MLTQRVWADLILGKRFLFRGALLNVISDARTFFVPGSHAIPR